MDPGRLHEVLLRTYERPPEDFASLLGTAGLGPKSLRALALTAEVIYGTKASTRDPARFAFAHGGKDGTPYPVDRATYDMTIEVLHNALRRAKVDRSERISALKRLAAFGRRPGAPTGPAPSSPRRAPRWRLALNARPRADATQPVAARRRGMTTLLYPHPSSLEHDTGPGHPESIARMRAIMAALDAAERKGALVGVERREPPRATRAQLERRAHGALRRRRAARRAGLGARAPRP